MLETINLTKIYRPKKGVPVTALDGVSLKFPDKGMVFLLGKSGSGKSTLLNLLGGLDKYDDGEIIIKGVSSKDFKQQHFDSYRNTYVGFIFQEYNILDDFSVGANIALAIELQGRKATDEELNRILSDVDLDGYGNRRPNELSGGQKQRVAIARALVKNPKIIMADEPSGALDSATGKQVFDTLKKLSKEKLVIVVSHDRDFATQYADRIIELADGKVISDTTLCESAEETVEQGISFDGATARIPMGYHLTEEDRLAINEYMDKLQSEGKIEFAENKSNKNFIPTNQDEIKSEDKSPFKLIKSKLALKHAFKIGSGGLKHKKFRLVMTILLSCIAFTLFGLVDTFSSYDHIKTTANSVYDTGIKYATVTKQVKIGEGLDAYWRQYGTKLSAEEIAAMSEATGIDFKPVLNDTYLTFADHIGNLKTDEQTSIYELSALQFWGIAEMTQEDIDQKDYKLIAGRIPDGSKNEIVISTYVCDTFIESGYRTRNSDGVFSATEKIENYSDMVGKTFYLDEEYEIVGIIDTNFDMTRYETMIQEDENQDAAGEILDYVLYTEFRSAVENDYTGMMITGEGFVDRFLKKGLLSRRLSNADVYFTTGDDTSWYYPSYVAKLENVDKNEIVWLDGEHKSLGEKEIIVLESDLYNQFGLAYFDELGNLILDEEIADTDFIFYYWNYSNGDRGYEEDGYKIVGYIKNLDANDKYVSNYNTVVLPDSIFDKLIGESDEIYDMALGTMPESKGDIEALAEYCYTENNGIKYALNNPASFELDALNEIIEVLAKVFLYVGLGFALFAAILLSNFIATSIAYKKQEIGILRAIGSRGNDVFRIFFAEAFIIAMINFVLACIGTGAITFIINTILREEVGLLITVLNFGFRQILFIFGVSVAVAAIASFLPVKKIASKRPIDAIRGR